jgi:hypothetical protein
VEKGEPRITGIELETETQTQAVLAHNAEAVGEEDARLAGEESLEESLAGLPRSHGSRGSLVRDEVPGRAGQAGAEAEPLIRRPGKPERSLPLPGRGGQHPDRQLLPLARSDLDDEVLILDAPLPLEERLNNKTTNRV